jgi:hypothetical protein
MVLFLGIMVFTFALTVLSFPVGLYTVFGTHLSNNDSASTPVYALTYDFSFATVQVPIVGNLGEVFAVFLGIYFGFLVLAAKQGPGFFGTLRKAALDGYSALFSNPLAAMMVVLGATSLITVLVDTGQSNAGIQTGSLTGDSFALLVDFTVAPLLEESTFRFIMLGVPVLLLALFIFRDFSPRNALRVLWRPSSAWDDDETDYGRTTASFADADISLFPTAGLGSLKARAMKPIVYVFLVLSSIMFGYAHYASGAGWGPGKISEAAIAGVALGYLYVKYGFHASVLMHWSVNYVGSIYSFFGQAAYGVPWTSSTGSFLDYLPTVVVVFLLGLPSLLLLTNEFVKRRFKNASLQDYP